MSASFSTPQKAKPNPHPYAIKTSTTGLLSNSSSFSTTSGTHHYIPPSPSPSPTQNGFGGATTRHRYSSSESPRPLPPPPSATALLGSEDDDTPRRVHRAYSLPQLPEDPKRWSPAEVSLYLTSSLNAASVGGGPTPVAHDIATFVKDKKITGRRFLRLNEVDLEEYGINQLWRTTLVDASRALRRNVLRGHIWGNPTELDNKDDDYDDNNLSTNSNYVVNNRKRSLSTASQSRGRVRDMVDTLERSSSDSSSEQEEEENWTRRNKDTTSKRDNHHRHRSLEQQQQGRLPQRGSVSTLFGISEPGPERGIEDQDTTITAHTRRNVNSNGPRLLPFPPTGSTGTSDHRHAHAHIVSPSHTGTSHPFPPNPLDHQQTAPYHALNAQPLHHQPFIFPSHSQQHNHTPVTLDYYELGFKNSFPLPPPIQSPNSQRSYVVQHNNAQPPPSSSSTPGVVGHSTGGSSKGSRLLPYPPIVGEAELFHPRPRMGVGVNGLASELENKLDDGDVEGDETIYHSALDIQTGIDDPSENGGDGQGSPTAVASDEETLSSGNDFETRAGNDATDGVEHPEKAKEEGESGIQGVLLPQSQTRPRVISGVEAWEMELGETVNRIGSNGSISTSTGSISSIGGTKTRMRPRKREVNMGGIGMKNGNGKMIEDDGSSKKMMTGILGSELFEAPNSVAKEGDTVDDNGSAAFASTFSARQSALDERESKIAALESSLKVRESSIAERDSVITERESSIVDRESSITDRESSISDRESSLDIRESCITSRESAISKLESDITARDSALTTYESEIQRRMGDIEQREMEMEKRESEVEKREQEVFECETRVEKIVSEAEKRERDVSEREMEVEKRENEVEKREQEVFDCEMRVEKIVSEAEKREREVFERESEVEKNESEVEKREQEVTERETVVGKRKFEMEKREREVSERETGVEKRESGVDKREQEASECETRVEKRENRVENREQEVSERETKVESREVEVKEWYQRKSSEIDERVLVVDVPTTTTITASASSSSSPAASSCTAESKWPPSPLEFARRFCATLLPVLGEDTTPDILLPGNGAADSSTSSSTTFSTSTSSSSITTTPSPTLPGVPFWSLKRDHFVNRLLEATAGGGSFLVLVGIGVCVIFLRGVVKRVLRVAPGGFGRR